MFVSDPYALDRCWSGSGSGSSILGWIPIRIQNQGFDDQNLKKFTAKKICNQCFGSVLIDYGSGSSILGWIPIRIQGFYNQKFKKMYSGKKSDKFLIKTYNLLIPRPPSNRKSLQPSKENIQHFKNEISNFFLLLYVIFFLLDPDPDMDPLTWLNPDPCEYDG